MILTLTRTPTLLDELEPNEEFPDRIYQDVFALDRLKEIRTCQTRRQRMTKFLSILPYCREQAYTSFIVALQAKTGSTLRTYYRR